MPPPRVLGYRRHLAGEPTGRALVSYVPEPLVEESAGVAAVEFSNRGISRSIARALNELGYEVDVVSWLDAGFEPLHEYDVLVQHGGANFDHLRDRLGDDTRIVYFSTGGYWRFHNDRAQRRADDFQRRHGVELRPDRLIVHSEESATRDADGIIALGSASILDTYADFPLVLPLDLGAYADPQYEQLERDVAGSRNRFLFFAGGGNLHKGLDLALEAFAGTPYELDVATYLSRELLDVYRPLLRENPNIRLVGPVGFRSAEFYALMERCAFVVLLSCSEGQPGSVVECMNEGLIPLVTREVNLDTSGYGTTIAGAAVADVRAAAAELATLPDHEVRRMSTVARRTVLERHSPDRFVSRFADHIRTILEAARRDR